MAIGGADCRIGAKFSHANHASIGKIHGRVRIAIKQFAQRRKFTAQGNRSQPAAFDEFKNFAARDAVFRDEVTDFRQHRFTDQTTCRKLRESLARPGVVFIARTESRDQRSGIKDDRPHRPKSSR